MTGGIGAGKSAIAGLMGEQGAYIISGDEIGREVMEEAPGMLEWVRENFGDGVFDDKGDLLRQKLGDAVFSDEAKKKQLDNKIFPEIYKRLKSKIKTAFNKHKIVVVDAAMIFEWGIEGDFDLILTVIADEEAVLERLSQRDGFDAPRAVMRIKSQFPPEAKAEKADYVIENNGSKVELKLKVARFWREKVMGKMNDE